MSRRDCTVRMDEIADPSGGNDDRAFASPRHATWLAQAGRTSVIDCSALASDLRIDADPLLTRVFRLPAAFPQYVVGHGERVAAILARVAAHPGLFVTGASYEGIGIPDCIGAAERCAAAVSRYLG